MKKIIKKMKGKKVLSFVLAAIMLATTFNMALPMLKLDASAAINLGGITQERVVSNYESTYAAYANRFFGGNGKSEPTNFVIPGLSSANDYTPQGMTYWKAKDWILISAYDASGAGEHSVIYALDGKTTEFVALFKILNSNGSVNTSHGGGIAASEYNFYYADSSSKISYIPLSEMDVAPGTVKEIKLKGSINCASELNSVATSYCCYDEGVLWTGNFYISSDDRYSKKAFESYPSVLAGYKLHGNSSEEEWHYLSTNNNVTIVPTSFAEQTSGAMKYTTKYSKNYRDVEITGSITTSTSIGELTANFAKFSLTEGQKYKIEFISDNNLSDLYMFAPTGNHCNVKQSQSSKVTQLSDGRYHYQMIFTAGLKPNGADSSWPTTQSTNGTYTGEYTLRFDQDSITGNRNFRITNLAISKYTESSYDSSYEGADCVGNPSYYVAFDSSIDKIQYAMVDNGRIYISRSWSRSESSNHTRALAVGDIDLNAPGRGQLTVNGKVRACHIVGSSNVTTFGGNANDGNRTRMLFMGEALCVIEGYLYMFGEGAAWTYNGKEDNTCPEPIDVIWKIDQYAIMGETRETDNEKLDHYELVTSLDQIKNTNNPLLNTDEYIIVYESPEKDPVTQKNILYALDAFGGHNGNKLPKEAGSGIADYIYGIVGHPITQYSIDGNNLYLTNPEKDDRESIRWKFSGAQGNFDLESTALYYSTYKSFCLNGMESSMSKDTQAKFTLDFSGENVRVHTGLQYLWCNDGTKGYEKTINQRYISSGFSYTEEPGTFHTNATLTGNAGNIVGKAVPDELSYLKLYKRVLDPYAEKEISKVYTNSTAELQADGTYTLNLETYATSSAHYKLLDEQRPTDFIFVLDTSGSMSTEDCNGYHRHNSFDLEAAANNDKVASHTNNSSNSSTTATYTGNMWIQHTDGAMCPVTVKVQGDGRNSNIINRTYYQRVYLWYTHPTTGAKYWFHPNSDDAYGTWTTSETTYDQAMRIGGTSQNERKGRVVFSGVCYEKRSNSSRLSNLQLAVNNLTYKIQNEAATTGLDHRIAVVQYGSNSSGSWTNTGMYTNAGTSRVAYTGAGTVSAGNYQKAFFKTNQFDTVRTIINNLSASGDTFVDYGFDMAQNIIANAKGIDGNTGYTSGGNRSACIIMITDGCPGFGGNDSATATTVANAAIKNAGLAKKNGAYVFTVQLGNNSMSGFEMGTYMDYTSSEYIGSENMTTPGDRNTNDVNYRLDVPAGSSFNLDNFVNSMFDNVTANSRNALEQLDSSSIIREVLGDSFIAPTQAEINANMTIKTVPGYYDGLGRIAFDDNKAQTVNYSNSYNQSTRTLTVSGFDYSKEYISKNKNTEATYGKKLVVSIKGLLPDSGKQIISDEVSESFKTAIYQSSTAMNNTTTNNDLAFKHFPTDYISIPEYTYVLDYGLYMLDTDVNGTLCSVSDTLSKQSTYKYITDNGAVAIDRASRNQNLLYSISPTATEQSGYTLIQRDDGTYDWFKINVVPASNVYYEETSMKANNGGTGTKTWSAVTEGSSADYRDLNGDGNVYGYDEAYANNNTYSNGSAYYAEVDATDKRSQKATFTFKGTGFDLISTCGPDTGVQVINIKKPDGKQKALVVDTYFNDANYGELHQVPIVSWTDTTPVYGTYTVETTATYLTSAGAVKKSATKQNLIDTGIVMNSATVSDTSDIQALLKEAGVDDIKTDDIELIWFDDNSVLNGGTGVEPTKKKNRAGETTEAVTLKNYVDGFRVYNPLDKGSSEYSAAEKNAVYANVVDNLGSPAINQGITEGMAYTTGSLTEGTLSFANYESVGPENEFYLNGNKQLSIALSLSAGEKVMLGLRAVSGPTTFTVTSTDGTTITNIPVNGPTEMYYDVSACLNDTIKANGGVTTVSITNNGNNLLAVNHLKLSGLEQANGLLPAPRSMGRSTDATQVIESKFAPITEADLALIQSNLAAPGVQGIVKNGVVLPLIEEEEEIIPDDNITPDVPGNENTGNDDTTNDDTNTDSGDKEFSIFSLLELLISLIEKLLYNAFGAGSLF